MPRYRMLTPGPVAVPERVRLAMASTLVHHRAAEFLPIFTAARTGLKKVFQTESDVLVLASSGSGAMEAAVANLTRRGEKAIVVRGGKFGERWAELCAAYGIEAVCVDVEWGRAVDPEAVRRAFTANPDARTLFVQASETSTGAYHPIRELADVCHEGDAERLIVVDGISAVGVHDLPMDAWKLDCVVSGSQKSFALPPGLSFVALRESARAAVMASDHPRYYLDLRKELRGQADGSTAYSPAVSLIVGLREALAMMLEEGLEHVFARHKHLARITRGAMEALGLALFAPDAPSFACTAVRVPDGIDGEKLVRGIRDEHGITIAGGQAQLAGKIFRIGHMGDVDAFDMLAAVAAVEMTLANLGHPVELGAGTRKAIEIMRAPMPAGRS